MANSKTTEVRIILQKEKMAQMENDLKKLLRQQKEEDRRERTRRICQRGGLLEKLLPETIPFDEKQILAFFEKTLLTPFARRVLAEVAPPQNGGVSMETGSTDQQGDPASAAKAPEAVKQAV